LRVESKSVARELARNPTDVKRSIFISKDLLKPEPLRIMPPFLPQNRTVRNIRRGWGCAHLAQLEAEIAREKAMPAVPMVVEVFLASSYGARPHHTLAGRWR
jgi:hypothetical protein